MKTTISFDKMADRQDLIPLMETRRQGLEPYMMDRTDMFWARVEITDEGLKADLSYCIDTNSFNKEWHLSFQCGSKLLDTEEVRKKVMKKWQESPESLQAFTWLSNLTQAGYFDRGRFGAPNANEACCIHCDHSFEKGTSHPHTYLPEEWTGSKRRKIIYHHKQMEKTIKERSLTKQGVSALPDIPSLEEKGKLPWHVVGTEA